jgi:hypothetical protein
MIEEGRQGQRPRKFSIIVHSAARAVGCNVIDEQFWIFVRPRSQAGAAWSIRGALAASISEVIDRLAQVPGPELDQAGSVDRP